MYDANGDEVFAEDVLTPEELREYREQLADRPRSVLRTLRAARWGK